MSGSKRMRWTRLASVALRLRGVADVVEHVVAPDAEVLELDPLTAVRMLHPHVAAGAADAVADAPVMVPRAEVGLAPEREAFAVRLHPALLAAEAVVPGDRAHGAAADDHAGAELAEHRALGVVPGDVVRDAVAPEWSGARSRSGVEPEAPLAEGLDELEAERSERHVHAVGGKRPVGPHRGVAAPHVDDGEGLRRPEIGVEGEADDDEELAHLVLAGEPHSLVGLGVGCPHDADRVGRVVDQELIEAAQGRVLVGGGVGGCAGARRSASAGPVRSYRRVRGGVLGPVAGRRQPPVAAGEAVVPGPHRACTVRSDRVRGPAHRLRRDAAFFARDDYYEVLARLRAEDPVHECAPGFWAVTRYEDIRDLSRDPVRFCSGAGCAGQRPHPSERRAMPARSILHMDPPEHAAFRGLVNRRFTPRALSGLAESIRRRRVQPARRGARRTRRSTSSPSWPPRSRSP